MLSETGRDPNIHSGNEPGITLGSSVQPGHQTYTQPLHQSQLFTRYLVIRKAS